MSISGFDIGDQKELEKRQKESEGLKKVNVELAEIIDSQVIHYLINKFYNYTHIPIGLTDAKGNFILGVGWQDICTRFHRVHPETFKHCVESDTKLTSGALLGKSRFNRCKNNMCDIATPITVGDMQVGVIFLGQFLFDDEPLDYEWIQLPEGTNISKTSPERKRDVTHKLFKDGVEIPKEERPLRMSVSGKEVQDYELDIVYPEGKIRHILCNARPLRDEQDKPRGAVAAMIDITECKKVEKDLNEAYKKLQIQSKKLQASNEELQAQSQELQAQTESLHNAYQALSKSEERYRMLFSNMTEAFFLAEIIYNEDGKPFDFHYLEINPAFELHTGIKREQIVGKSFLDAFANTNFVNIDKFFEVAHSGKSANFELLETSTNRYFEVHAFTPEKGKVASIFRNITGRKQMEEALRKSEEKYRSIVETANECIVITNKEATVTFANKRMEEVFGYGLEEVIGRPMLGFISEESKAIFQRLPENGWQNISGSIEIKLIRKNGSLMWSHVNIKSLFDFNGQFIGVLGMLTDVTERKKAEIELKKTLDNLEIIVKNRTAKLEESYKLSMENERKLIEAQRIAHTGNWEWDIVKDKACWSEEMYRIFGRNPQEGAPAYNELLNYIKAEDRDYVVNAFSKGQGREPYFIEFGIISDIGEELTVYMQSETIFEGEAPVLMKGTVQDITKSRKAEEKIRLLAKLVESSSNAIMTESIDGVITSWNKGAELIYGYSAEEVLGKSVSILAPSHLIDETIKRSKEVKQTESIQEFETVRLRKDGKKIHVSIALGPVFDTNGKITAISIISTDITGRKIVEDKLRGSEERYRNIVETSNEGIFLTDKEFRVSYFNKKMTDIIGFTIEEFMNRSIWDIVPEESKDIIEMNLKNRMLGIENDYEAKLLHKDGSKIWVHINGKILYDDNGESIGILAMIDDISKRKEAEENLAKIETIRKQEIHHRIKNNLQVISSLLDLQAEKFKNRKDINDSEVLEAFKESQNRVISMALIHEELYKGGGLDSLEFSSYTEVLTKNLLSTNKLGDVDISINLNLGKNIFFDMDIAVPLGIIVNELVTNCFKHAFPGEIKGKFV